MSFLTRPYAYARGTGEDYFRDLADALFVALRVLFRIPDRMRRIGRDGHLVEPHQGALVGRDILDGHASGGHDAVDHADQARRVVCRNVSGILFWHAKERDGIKFKGAIGQLPAYCQVIGAGTFLVKYFDIIFLVGFKIKFSGPLGRILAPLAGMGVAGN